MPTIEKISYDAVESPPLLTGASPAVSDIMRLQRGDYVVESDLATVLGLAAVVDLPNILDGGAPGQTPDIVLDGGLPGQTPDVILDGGNPGGATIGTVKFLVRAGTAAQWAAAGDQVLSLAEPAILLETIGGVVRARRFGFGDDVTPFSALQWLIEDQWTAAEKTKLAGVQTGAQVNPVQVSVAEKTAGTELTARTYAPADVRDMILVHGPSISIPAQVSSTERTAGTEAALRSFSPNDVRIMILAHAPGGAGAVASVFGRAGIVLASAGDYTADQITDQSGTAGTTKVIMTLAERNQLVAYAAREKGDLVVTTSRTFTAADLGYRFIVAGNNVDLTVPVGLGWAVEGASEIEIIVQPDVTGARLVRGSTSVIIGRCGDVTSGAGPHALTPYGRYLLRRIRDNAGSANLYSVTGYF